MAQNPITYPDHANGAALISDRNDAAETLATNFSGDTAPETPYPNQWWADTSTGRMMRRNSDNDAWIDCGPLDGSLGTASGYDVGTAAGEVPTNASAGSVLSMANGIYSWWNEPLAVHYKDQRDRTYFGSISSDSNLWVFSYDHKTGETQRTLLRESFDTGYLPSDDHCAPVILMGRKGTADPVMAFYVAHQKDNKLYYKVSDGHESVESFGAEQTLEVTTATGTLSYVQVHRYEQNIVVITRITNGSDRSWGMFTSQDNGQTWSAFKTFFNQGDSVTWKYLHTRQNGEPKLSSGQGGEIVSVCVATHPENSSSQNFWYFNINLSTGNALGGNLYTGAGLPVNTGTSGVTLYYTAGTGEKTRLIDFINPVGGGEFRLRRMIIASFDTLHNAVYKIIGHTGTVEAEIPAGQPIEEPPGGTSYFPGAALLDSTAAVFIRENTFSSSTSGGRYMMEQWQSKPSLSQTGDEWYPAGVLLSVKEGQDETRRKIFRPYSVRFYAPEMPIIYIDGEYSDGFNVFDTSINTLPIHRKRVI